VRVTAVTYLGSVYGTLAALRRMLPRDRGVIVQVSSSLAFRSIPLQALYCGAKHAAKGFTEALRTELLHDGSSVRVTMVHLPALNTPQFDLVETRLPRTPRPVAPVYQPEVAADAIVWAARRTPRDLHVGFSTVAAVAAGKVAPGLVDRYLARTGLDAQQSPEPADPHRPSYLWEPVAGDHGAHGRFDGEARERSLHLLWRKHRPAALLAAGAVTAFALGKRLG
jgi:short-subunit dehydrogenase